MHLKTMALLAFILTISVAAVNYKTAPPAKAAFATLATITYYEWTGNAMSQPPYNFPVVGDAACGAGIYAHGTWVWIQRRDGENWDRYFCGDTGNLGYYHVDVYGVPNVASLYGDVANVLVDYEPN